MKQVRSTDVYDAFEAGLKDKVGRSRIQARIQRLACGNPGQCRHLEKGVSELKIDVGPGYRVYFTERVAGTIIILLAGGDKSTPDADIAQAYRLVSALKSDA
jgi:putative addiction module killer protein